MAARRPAVAVAQVPGVIDVANKQGAGCAREPPLGMASQAKILVPNGQQLRVHRAMRRVANGAAFAQCGMFKYKWPGLFPMTLRARFI